MYPKVSELNFKRIYHNESVRRIKIFDKDSSVLKR